MSVWNFPIPAPSHNTQSKHSLLSSCPILVFLLLSFLSLQAFTLLLLLDVLIPVRLTHSSSNTLLSISRTALLNTHTHTHTHTYTHTSHTHARVHTNTHITFTHARTHTQSKPLRSISFLQVKQALCLVVQGPLQAQCLPADPLPHPAWQKQAACWLSCQRECVFVCVCVCVIPPFLPRPFSGRSSCWLNACLVIVTCSTQSKY